MEVEVVTSAHRQLVARLTEADKAPNDSEAFGEWIRGSGHLEMLTQNAAEDEIIVAALSPGTCINSFIADGDHPDLHGDILALSRWSPNPLHHEATSFSWSWSLATDGVEATKHDGSWPHDLPADAHPLVFGRTIEGVTDRSGMYFEVLQEYVHAAEIHWRPEREAYSRIDFRGDWMDVISVSGPEGPHSTDLVSFRRESLDLYLIAMSAVLVRTFDVTLLRRPPSERYNYGEHVDRLVRIGSGLCYKEMVNEGRFGFIRGVQVIRPTLTPVEVEQLVKGGRIADPAEEIPVGFSIWDWRNDRIATVTTDPSTTTSYFDADQNDLPFETSPASFRPEVLSRYKADTEKYTVREGRITCRASWDLRSYWTNGAGQVCAYICDLRHLPREEQVYWSLFNEEPRAGLPGHVIKTDFRGEWLEEDDLPPIASLIHLLSRWIRRGFTWWRWADEGSPDGLTVPRTGSRKEWLDACLSLSSGLIEGFNLKAVRERLREVGGKYEKGDRSLLLLERLLHALGLIDTTERIAALWEVNELRVVRAHAARSKVRRFSHEALTAHGSYGGHFEDLCIRLVAELELIETAFGTPQ